MKRFSPFILVILITTLIFTSLSWAQSQSIPAQINTINNEIQSINTQTTDLQRVDQNLQSQITALQKDVTDLQSRVASRPNINLEGTTWKVDVLLGTVGNSFSSFSPQILYLYIGTQTGITFTGTLTRPGGLPVTVNGTIDGYAFTLYTSPDNSPPNLYRYWTATIEPKVKTMHGMAVNSDGTSTVNIASIVLSIQ